jgi:glycerol uptake facilitator protein
MKKDSLTGPFIGEVFGTFLLILLGDGVVANVGLAPRLASAAYNWNTISWGWGFAVVVAVYVTAGVSGAHLNPAVTFGLAVKGDFPWSKVIPYVIAQFIGAFLGALGVFLVYMEGLQATGMPNVWCTGPGAIIGAATFGAAGKEVVGSYSLLNASIAEFFGTAVLLWGILASGDTKNNAIGANLGGLLVGFVVVTVGLTLGGPSGYSINPARDLGPRIFGAIAGTQGLFDGIYWLIPPVLVPLLGGAFGCLSYDWLVSPFLPTEEPAGRQSEAEM